MSEKVFIEKVLDYCKSLEGTVEYRTPQYIGYKINSKMYAEVHTGKDFVRIHVNKKFLNEDDIKNLNVKVVPNSHGWTLNTQVKIDENSNLDNYLDIIRRCYEGIKGEYEEKLRNNINKAIEESYEYIKPYIEAEDYAFKKLTDKWKEFIKFDISNNSLDELKSDIASLDRYSSGDILNKYKNEEEKYNFLTLLFEVVAYADKNAYNKNLYNQYEDKRTLALTFVRQNEWVKSLINYKKYNDLSKVTEVVRNVIMYILSPSDKLSAFKNSKLVQFIRLLNPNIKVENYYEKLCETIYSELSKYDIKVKNEENRGRVYGHIMFSKELASLWNLENSFFKIQPYIANGLSREEVDGYLQNNVLVLKDKKINADESSKNIFYCVDGNKKLVLGTFTNEISEKNGLYYRKFIKLRETDKSVDELPYDKSWGNKYSIKQVVRVKEEEKESFESSVLNNIFEVDIDDLLEEIANMKPLEIEHKEEDEEVEEEIAEIVEEEKFEKEIETSLNMILYGPPGTGKTYNTVNYAVSIVEKKEIEEVVNESKKDRQGVFNRYKTYLSDKRITFTTFHQNYSYEDFIQGIRANTNNKDQLSFIKQDGIFKDLVERAKNDITNSYVMVIDEINRGNISRIFGELITLIEDDKRLGELNETAVTLPSKETFIVPPNLFILGTMNTADKSIANIDIALRRRFDFIPMYTDYSLIPEFEHILRPINKAIYDKKRTADYMIGHAFFINKTRLDLKNIINKKLIPLLNEYFYLNSGDVIDILSRGGIKLRENPDTFQLEFDGIEE
jgi:DNA replication protein DnaC/predicted transport protein